MRNVMRLLIGVAALALAGCVYPGYTYVRGGYDGGYYSGSAYGYDNGYYAPAYYGGYDCCDWYGPSVNIGLGYYGGGYYGGGYRHGGGYRRGGYDHRGYRGGHDRVWSGHSGRSGWHGSGSHGRHHH